MIGKKEGRDVVDIKTDMISLIDEYFGQAMNIPHLNNKHDGLIDLIKFMKQGHVYRIEMEGHSNEAEGE